MPVPNRANDPKRQALGGQGDFRTSQDWQGKNRLAYHPSGSEKPASWVDYSEENGHVYFPKKRSQKFINVHYLYSEKKGKGHAKTVMTELYNRFPNHIINWGDTIHPASTALAKQFEQEHYERTWYEPNHK